MVYLDRELGLLMSGLQSADNSCTAVISGIIDCALCSSADDPYQRHASCKTTLLPALRRVDNQLCLNQMSPEQ